MSATGGSEDIREDDQGAVALPNVVDRHTVDQEILALWLVVRGELLPGALWTTVHIFRSNIKMKIIYRLNRANGR